MHIEKSLLIIFLLMSQQACSSRQWYETVRENQRLQCQKVPYYEYNECMERASDNYEEYKRKREEVIQNK